MPPRAPALFAKLAVFAGGFTIEAAETDVGAAYGDVDALVDRSLLRAIEGDRFVMLETIREHALERLEASGDAEDARLRHAEYLVALGNSACLHTEADGPMRHELVIPERDNIRAALQWASDTGRQELGLRLAIALENWWVTTDADESVRWIESLLAPEPELPPLVRAGALRCLGNAATLASDPSGEALYAESLDFARSVDDERFVASVLHRCALWAVFKRASSTRVPCWRRASNWRGSSASRRCWPPSCSSAGTSSDAPAHRRRLSFSTTRAVSSRGSPASPGGSGTR